MKTLPAKLAVASERHQPLALEWGPTAGAGAMSRERGRACARHEVVEEGLANGEEIRTGAIDAAKMRVLEEWSE